MHKEKDHKYYYTPDVFLNNMCRDEVARTVCSTTTKSKSASAYI